MSKSLTSSIPGGLFGAAPEPQQRQRLDGRTDIRGRGNASSVAGGLFGEGPIADPYRKQPSLSQTSASAFDGAAGGKTNNAQQFHDGHFRGGTSKQPGQASVAPFRWDQGDAAGGKSSNSAQVRDGHWRGGTAKGGQRAPTGGNSFRQNRGGPGGGAADDDFLARLSQAEEADDEHERQLQELQVAAQNQQVARDAAAQIAAESGLGPQEQKRLERQIFARMNEALQMEVEAASPQSQQDDDEDEYYEEHDYYQQPQQAYQPAPHDRIRRPGHSPRVSGKPTSSPPSASYGFPPMAAGGYREAAASFNATASSIAGGIFG